MKYLARIVTLAGAIAVFATIEAAAIEWTVTFTEDDSGITVNWSAEQEADSTKVIDGYTVDYHWWYYDNECWERMLSQDDLDFTVTVTSKYFNFPSAHEDRVYYALGFNIRASYEDGTNSEMSHPPDFHRYGPEECPHN